MRCSIKSSAFAILLLSAWLQAQVPKLYQEDKLRSLDLTFKQANWWDLLKRNKDKAVFVAADLRVDNIVYRDVGVRFKGNASFANIGTSRKKPFQISMDAFNSAQDLYGFRTLNLGNGYHDPSFLREVLSYKLLREYMPAPRANFIKLTINKEIFGLYSNVEQVNRDFVNEHFQKSSGTRYKGDPSSRNAPPNGTALTWLGTLSLPYTLSYELKTSKHPNAWIDLIQLCNVLNNSGTTLATNLPKVLDVDRALWYLALQSLLVNLDSYLGAGQNFYLYNDPYHARFSIVPWDLNESFGVYALGLTIDKLQKLDPFFPLGNNQRPLADKLLRVPAWRERYTSHMRAVLDHSFNWTVLGPIAQKLHKFIDPEVKADPKKLYSYALFQNNLLQDVRVAATGPNDTPGLKRLVDLRRLFLMTVPDIAKIRPSITLVKQSPAQPTNQDPVWITAKIFSTVPIAKVELYVRTRGIFASQPMLDDGKHMDGPANDGVYGSRINNLPADTRVQYYISADNVTAGGGGVRFEPLFAGNKPFGYRVKIKPVGTSILINEFVAKNVSGYRDEKGQAEDWVELYNPTAKAVTVSGMYLTDDLNNPKSWKIPPGYTLQPGQSLLIWCDNDPLDGPLHATFRLDSNGEELGLYAVDGNTLLDGIKFGNQRSDESTGRLFDGKNFWVTFVTPTANTLNAPGSCGTRLFSVLDANTHPIRLGLLGSPKIATSPTLQVRNGIASSLIFLPISLSPGLIPLSPTTTVLTGLPILDILLLPANALGNIDIPLPIPNDNRLVGVSLYFQALAYDVINARFLASNAMDMKFCK